MPDLNDAPLIRDPEDAAAAAVRALDRVADGKPVQTVVTAGPSFSVEFGDPCCDAHVRNPDADPNRHYWWPSDDAPVRESEPLSDDWKPLGFTTEDEPERNTTATLEANVLRVEDTLTLREFRPIAPHVRVRKEDLEYRPSLRAVVAAQHAQAQARAEHEVMAAQIAESFRGPEDCAACWHKATTGTVPAIYCHSEGCEWEANRKADVAAMVNAMRPAAGDDTTNDELAAMATRILDTGFAPSARSHHAGAVAQADYLAALIAEDAERTAHSRGPHQYASDCARCGIDRALAVVRDARAGSDDE